MSINELVIGHNRDLMAKFRAQRNSIKNPQEKFDDAQIAILNIVQALSGLVDENKIIGAIGNARSSNAVSRALRSRLSFK